MKPNLDPEGVDVLLDAMLGDETWKAASAALKVEVVTRYRARQRRLQLMRWARGAIAVASLVASATYWVLHPAPAPRQRITGSAQAPNATQRPRNLTDEELVAAFPKGSCFIAEVDGKKELVFFDPDAERDYVARPGKESD